MDNEHQIEPEHFGAGTLGEMTPLDALAVCREFCGNNITRHMAVSLLALGLRMSRNQAEEFLDGQVTKPEATP